MQRRAAAIYFVFFLVVGAGAWAYIGVAEDTQRPQFSVSGTDFESGETHAIDGVEYSVGEIATASGGGDLESTITWTNESGLHTATIENETVIPYQDTNYTLMVANQSNVSTATLQQYYNLSAMLAADDAVENQLATYNGTDNVVYRDNGSLQPLAEYLPERDVVQFEVGDALEYEGNETTVREITSDGLTVGWTAPLQMDAGLSEGGNVTLADGQQYFTHFPNDNVVTVAPMSEYDGYAQTITDQNYFGERLAGLWAIVLFCGITALFLLSVAYMPVRG